MASSVEDWIEDTEEVLPDNPLLVVPEGKERCNVDILVEGAQVSLSSLDNVHELHHKDLLDLDEALEAFDEDSGDEDDYDSDHGVHFPDNKAVEKELMMVGVLLVHCAYHVQGGMGLYQEEELVGGKLDIPKIEEKDEEMYVIFVFARK
jgi:hypothetical protein